MAREHLVRRMVRRKKKKSSSGEGFKPNKRQRFESANAAAVNIVVSDPARYPPGSIAAVWAQAVIDSRT